MKMTFKELIKEGSWGYEPSSSDSFSDWAYEFEDFIKKQITIRIDENIKTNNLDNVYDAIGMWDLFKKTLFNGSLHPKGTISFNINSDFYKEMEKITKNAAKKLLKADYGNMYNDPDEVKNYLIKFINKGDEYND